MSNVRLRPVVDADHHFLVELHNDPIVLRNLTNPQPITFREHIGWWTSVKDNPQQRRLMFEVDGQRAGFTKFYDIDLINSCCVLGADLHSSFRGKKLSVPMWKLMLHMCFNDLGLNRVSLTTAEYNVIARHVYATLGFKEEGRLTKSLFRDGTYHDQILMYMLKDDYVT